MEVADDIQLTRAILNDAGDIFQAIDENRDSLRTWLPFVDTTKTVDDIVSFLKNTGEQVFIIRYEDAFAGLIGLKAIDEANHKAEIGYWMSPAMEGKGLMTRCCRRLMEYAFEELQLNRLLIQVAVDNHKSRRVSARLGFREEGIERDGELLVSGYTDLVRYGLLKREYNESF